MIYSVLGTKVMDTEYDQSTDISGLLPGVYILRYGDKTAKFVKK
jgi:hypothetical protein